MNLLKMLLVENNVEDISLVRRIIETEGFPITLSTVCDGAQALAYVRKEKPYAHAPTPDLVLMEFSLPKVHGHEVLGALRQPGVPYVPVVILSRSATAADVRMAYRAGANAYVQKPRCLSSYVSRLRALLEFCKTHVSLPIALSKESEESETSWRHASYR